MKTRGINFMVSADKYKAFKVALAMRGELISVALNRMVDAYIGDQAEQGRDLAEFMAAHKAQTIDQDIEAAR